MIELSLEAWKSNVQASDHVRPNETVRFIEGDDKVNAEIPHGNMPIFLGAYFTGTGRGWWHA